MLGVRWGRIGGKVNPTSLLIVLLSDLPPPSLFMRYTNFPLFPFGTMRELIAPSVIDPTLTGKKMRLALLHGPR
jgi:hypothetical protein